jgi:hypothetical protein
VTVGGERNVNTRWTFRLHPGQRDTIPAVCPWALVSSGERDHSVWSGHGFPVSRAPGSTKRARECGSRAPVPDRTRELHTDRASGAPRSTHRAPSRDRRAGGAGQAAHAKLHGTGTLVGIPQGEDEILDIYTGTLHRD